MPQFSIYPALIALAFVACSATGRATSPPAPATPPSEPLSIVIYDQADFKGRAVVLSQATPDLKAVNFDDKVASLTIQGAGNWVLCEHRAYKGRCVLVQSQANNLKLLQLNNRVSSLYPVPAVPVTTPPAGK